MRILSAWSEWAFITPRPQKNKLDCLLMIRMRRRGMKMLMMMTHIVQFLVKSTGIADLMIVMAMTLMRITMTTKMMMITYIV